MLKFSIIALIVGVGSVTASPAATAGCNADNCLRAIEGAAFVTRQGTIDCASYFKTTVIPATVTIISTISQTTNTATSTTNTVTVTSIESDFTTITSTSLEIDIATSTTVVTAPSSTLTFKLLVRKHATLDKRQATRTPSSIPTYVSACSGLVRYSSACSCVGATKSIVTAVAPSTTIYVTQVLTQTSTYFLSQTNTVISTDIITITATALQTTTSTILTTSTAMPTPVSSLDCDVPGFAVAQINSYGQGNAASCQAQCLNHPTCESFISNVGTCGFFILPVAEVADISSAAAPQVFYDRNCPLILSPTAP
ncbi:hypothetical protein N431DRAFT_475399 [Stipitochalara longipes BDJ]|nr:hypothetical protein N431DRAFT_475399 [Stipitochalara longipes BDJ]